MPRALVLFALTLSGCSPLDPADPPRPATPPTAREPAPEAEDAPTEDQLRKLAEPLPPAPLADPKNSHKKLVPGGELLLETRPDPADAKKSKPVRVLLQTEVCNRDAALELLLCQGHTKRHEAILNTTVDPKDPRGAARVDARLVHAALVAAGMTPGSPVQFVDPATGDEKYKPATGAKVKVSVHYRRAGQAHTHPAQEWVRELKTKKPMTHHWVFAGSQLYTDPDDPKRPPYYTANSGDVISLSNFPTAMLDLPVMSSQDNTALGFGTITEKIPPLRSGVWVIFEAGN